jgi:hypothetical protein
MTQLSASQTMFQSLTVKDRMTLLKNNIPLYIQYIMSRLVKSLLAHNATFILRKPITLNVFMLSVIMLNVVAPYRKYQMLCIKIRSSIDDIIGQKNLKMAKNAEHFPQLYNH